MDCIVHGVAKSQTRLRDLHFHFHFSTCFQNRSRLTDTENKLIVTKGEKWGEINLEFGINRNTTTIYKLDKQQGPNV